MSAWSVSRRRSFLVLGCCLAWTGIAAAGEAVYLKPGQCVIIAGQQVCAMASDMTTVEKAQILYVCRYGVHEGAEVPDLKNYALVQVRVDPTGVKTETLVKNFGQNDREICEKEAEKREAEAKR